MMHGIKINPKDRATIVYAFHKMAIDDTAM